ncbi:DUF1853 family protein [Chitinivorax sp. PXF-14]|uniref:DUF1853 family protein n=1 Tax=Chitinivorax sp. PXF-14 TaxID=3230488 RepID=UPI0034652A38
MWLDTVLPHLSDLHVRNLAWLLAGPGLLDRDDGYWRQRSLPATCLPPTLGDALLRLDAAPAPLHRWIESELDGRLGRYAERLWEYGFAFLCGANLLARGLAIKDGASTVGELDFLVDWPAEGVVHIETAFKLYLAVEAVADPSQCVGPNPSDCLADKLKRLRDHQLPLASSALAQAQMPLPAARSVACVGGWLFHRQAPANAVPEVSRQHAHGWWRRPGEAWPVSPGSRIVMLQRLQWIAPVHASTAAGCLDEAEAQVRLHFTHSHKPVLLAELGLDGEIGRGVIVPAGWPERRHGEPR